MPAETPPAGWGDSGFNSAWTFRVSDLACRLLPPEAIRTAAESVMDWYAGRRPDTLAALESNLRGAFPGMTPARTEALALSTLHNYGRGVADYLRGLSHPPPIDPAPGAWEALQACPGGKVFLCAHIGNWEVGGFFIGRVVGPHHVVGFPERDRAVEEFREKRRATAGLTTHMARSGLHNLFTLRRVLEGGEAVILLVDRAAGKDRVEVRFRGRPAWFLRSPAVLASLADVWALPTAVVAAGGGRYRALVGPPCRHPGETVAPGEVIQRAAGWFGEVLEQYPDQWYNFFPYWREAP